MVHFTLHFSPNMDTSWFNSDYCTMKVCDLRPAVCSACAGLLPNWLLAFWTSNECLIGKSYCLSQKALIAFMFLRLRVLNWRIPCCSETLPVEYLGGKPLCMDQYYQVLSSCRIPGPKKDTVVNHAIGKTAPTHITVVHNFQVTCWIIWLVCICGHWSCVGAFTCTPFPHLFYQVFCSGRIQ